MKGDLVLIISFVLSKFTRNHSLFVFFWGVLVGGKKEWTKEKGWESEWISNGKVQGCEITSSYRWVSRCAVLRSFAYSRFRFESISESTVGHDFLFRFSWWESLLLQLSALSSCESPNILFRMSRFLAFYPNKSRSHLWSCTAAAFIELCLLSFPSMRLKFVVGGFSF